MKCFAAIFILLMLPVLLVAQTGTGSIVGTVLDEDGKGIPGVTVLAAGTKHGNRNGNAISNGWSVISAFITSFTVNLIPTLRVNDSSVGAGGICD